MPTATTSLRLADADLELLDRLQVELGLSSRSEVIRGAARALLQDAELRAEIRASNVAEAFIAKLKREYAGRPFLEFDMGAKPPALRIGGEQTSEAAVELRAIDDDLVALDLIDRTTGVVIRNAYLTGSEPKLLVLPLEYLRVSSPIPMPGSRAVHSLDEGRSVVEITDEDGTTRQLVLDKDGASALLEHEPRAEFA